MTYLAIGFLALILLASVLILVLTFTNRLPFPKQPPEPTEFQKAANELSDSINEVQRAIGEAMRPPMEKLARAFSEFGRKS